MRVILASFRPTLDGGVGIYFQVTCGYMLADWQYSILEKHDALVISE